MPHARFYWYNVPGYVHPRCVPQPAVRCLRQDSQRGRLHQGHRDCIFAGGSHPGDGGTPQHPVRDGYRGRGVQQAPRRYIPIHEGRKPALSPAPRTTQPLQPQHADPRRPDTHDDMRGEGHGGPLQEQCTRGPGCPELCSGKRSSCKDSGQCLVT